MTHATTTTTTPDSAPRSLSAAEVQQVAGGPVIKNMNEVIADEPRTLSAAEVVAVAGGPVIQNMDD